jgi:hypothetical protein
MLGLFESMHIRLLWIHARKQKFGMEMNEYMKYPKKLLETTERAIPLINKHMNWSTQLRALKRDRS